MKDLITKLIHELASGIDKSKPPIHFKEVNGETYHLFQLKPNREPFTIVTEIGEQKIYCCFRSLDDIYNE